MPDTDALRALQDRQRGVFRRKQALDLGWTSAQLATALKRGVLLDCHGAYCLAENLSDAQHEARRAAARMLVTAGDLVASHATAAVILGFPYVDAPERAVVTRHSGTVRAHLRHVLSAPVPSEHRIQALGVPLTSAARTTADLARTAQHKYDAQGVVDAALRHGVDRAEVDDVLAFCSGWPGVVQARTALQFAEPRCESPLESRVRWWLYDAGLPLPECQVVVVSGRASYRVDFLYAEQRLVIEADGKAKYRSDARWLSEQERRRFNPASVVWEEKRREDALREDGYRFLRAYSSDGKDGGRAFAARVAKALGLPVPVHAVGA